MNVLDLREFGGDELLELIRDALNLKEGRVQDDSSARRRGLLVLMQKPSTRTSLSFQSAMGRLGGYSVALDWAKTNFSISPARHEIRYASRNCDVVLARFRSYDDLAELAEYSRVPVINGCCSRYHPTQALADLMTIYEVNGGFDGVTLTYVGVHNNVANSLVVACSRLGVRLLLFTPIVNAASWDDELMAEAMATGLIERVDDLQPALDHSGFVYTDTWIDMEFFADEGYAEGRERRIATMLPFQLNHSLLAERDIRVMHDMPMHPGLEISEEIIDDSRSIIFQQAENRMYVAQALLRHLLPTAYAAH